MRVASILFVAALAGAISLTSSSAALATSLAGDTIHGYYEYPAQSSVFLDLGTFSAPGGGNLFTEVNYSVTGDQITFTSTISGGPSYLAASFNGFTFDDIARDPHITGITLDPAT